MMRCVWVLLLIVAAGCEELPPPDAPVEVLFEDIFDNENDEMGVVNYAEFAQWDVVAGSVDLIGNDFYDFYPGNGLYVDLDGTTNEAGTLTTKQTFDLEPGEYTLAFSLAGPIRAGADTVTVTLGELFEEEFALAQNAPFEAFERPVVVDAASEAKISFVLTGGDNEGILLDNVSLTRLAE